MQNHVENVQSHTIYDTELRKLFELLGQRRLGYCLIRGYEELATGYIEGDVDLLVNAASFREFTFSIAELGYTSIPYAGHGPHHFFFKYVVKEDRWIKLDVLTEIAFGKPVKSYHTNLARNCLWNSRDAGGVLVPAPEDEMIVLLLHALIDKGAFAPKHIGRINLLLPQITDSAYMTNLVQRYWLPDMSWEQLRILLSNGDTVSLLRDRRAVMHHIAGQKQVLTQWRRVNQRLLRRFDGILFNGKRRSALVAFLAPDGAGKTTLAQDLTKTFYFPSRYIYMGTNIEASTIGLPTTRKLNTVINRGEQGSRGVRYRVARALRFPNTLLEQWLRLGASYYFRQRGRLVLLDRYVYDSQLYPQGYQTWKSRLRRWLLNRPAPTPDLIVMLDAPGDVLFARKGEHSPALLEEQRQRYLAMQPELPQMVVVDATQHAVEVRKQVTALIWNTYQLRNSTGDM